MAIKESDLYNLVAKINELTGSPLEPYCFKGTECLINIGHYSITKCTNTIEDTMTIYEFPNPRQCRHESLKEVRAANITNALYLAESQEEVLEGLKHVHPDNLRVMITMINEILDDGELA